MSDVLVENICSFITDRYQKKLEELDKKYLPFDLDLDECELEQKKAEYDQERLSLAAEYRVESWVDEVSQQVHNVTVATHILKFINSSAQGTSLMDAKLGTDARYVDTESLLNSTPDMTCNAKYMYIAGVLDLKDSQGRSLLWYLNHKNYEPLQKLAERISSTHVNRWIAGFCQLFENSTLKTHTLAKQVYFPIDESDFHLVLPLYSSTLSQAVFEKIQYSKYSKEMKVIRDAKKSHLFASGVLINYPNLALITTGGSKPQNISKLNLLRHGQTYLFRSAPPQWVKNKYPKFHDRTFITHYEIYRGTRQSIQTLAKFLIKINSTDISSNIRIRNYITRSINEIIDEIVMIIGYWRELPSGWTDSKDYAQLPIEQRRLLDPKNERFSDYQDDWSVTISRDIALWIKDRINEEAGEAFVLSNIEVSLWARLCHEAIERM